MPISASDVPVVPRSAAKASTPVSTPSRATAMNATATTATGPSLIASSSLDCSSPLMPRAARRIQKIIQVTKTTATSEAIASNNSCWAWVSRLSSTETSSTVSPTLSATAVDTPSHTSRR